MPSVLHRSSLARPGALLPALALCLLTGCATPPPAETEPESAAVPPPEGTPQLVLFVAIDQFTGSYVERFRPLFNGGLATLLERGVVFSDTHHAHANTSTSPGHATLSTGDRPATHGIVNNSWYQRDEGTDVYSCDDTEFGRSPRRMISPTLGDRMKERYPQAKVFAIGGKDRASILTAGHHADGVFWYDRSSGRFTTSDYYPEPGTERAWLEEFHDRKLLDERFAEPWQALRELSAEEARSYDIEPLDQGLFTSTLPRALGGLGMQPDRSYYSAVYGSPRMDWYVVELAKALIAGEELGTDEVPDFFGVTLSALDAVGHSFGPNAPETLDTLLRVDQVLGDLFAWVDERIGMDNVLVTLSSDHGVGQVPELATRRGLDAGRFGTEARLCFQSAGREIAEKYDLADLDWMPWMGYLAADELRARGIDVALLTEDVRSRFAACPRVAAVHLPQEVLDAEDERTALFRGSYHPDRSPDLMIELLPNTLSSSTVASHGTPNEYDSWVPWMLMAPDLAPAQIEQRVATIDVAPTVASWLDLELDVDGRNRRPMLQ